MKSSSILLIYCLLGLACNAQPLEDEEAAEIRLIAMTYNIHHGAGSDGVVNLQRIANVILSAQPDLVALQEVDRFVERTDRVDQATALASLTGMHMRFGFADHYQGGDFGNVILSKHPIDTLILHPLPGPPGETRVLMESLIQVPFNDTLFPITFMATHLETIEAPRRASVPLISALIPQNPDHLYILGGDLNATPTAPTMDSLTLKLINPTAFQPVFTHPAEKPVRQLDYLLFKGPSSWTVEGASALSAPISSDHLPLVTVFNLKQLAAR